MIQGAWCISTWEKENPDLEFGVMEMPVPDEGAKGGLPYIGAQPWMGISKTSENPNWQQNIFRDSILKNISQGL